MNKVAKSLYLLKKKFLKRRYPLWILINVTNQCPYSCKYCNLSRDKDKIISTRAIIKLIDNCARIGIKFITLTGGEPLVRDDIADLIMYIRRRENFDLRISTEGIGNSVDKMKILKQVDLVNLSFDGPADIHDYQRYRGAFQRFMRNISFFKTQNIPFRAICVLTKKNISYIDYILDFAKTKKFDVFFQPLSNTYFYRGKIPDEFVLDKDEIKEIAQLLIKRKKKNKYLANSTTMLNFLLGHNIYFYKCYAKEFFIYAHFDGSIYHCWVNPVTPLGNIYEQTLEEILDKNFDYDYTKCECSSYSCVEKNCLISSNPIFYFFNKYL